MAGSPPPKRLPREGPGVRLSQADVAEVTRIEREELLPLGSAGQNGVQPVQLDAASGAGLGGQYGAARRHGFGGGRHYAGDVHGLAPPARGGPAAPHKLGHDRRPSRAG